MGHFFAPPFSDKMASLLARSFSVIVPSDSESDSDTAVGRPWRQGERPSAKNADTPSLSGDTEIEVETEVSESDSEIDSDEEEADAMWELIANYHHVLEKGEGVTMANTFAQEAKEDHVDAIGQYLTTLEAELTRVLGPQCILSTRGSAAFIRLHQHLRTSIPELVQHVCQHLEERVQDLPSCCFDQVQQTWLLGAARYNYTVHLYRPQWECRKVILALAVDHVCGKPLSAAFFSFALYFIFICVTPF